MCDIMTLSMHMILLHTQTGTFLLFAIRDLPDVRFISSEC